MEEKFVVFKLLVKNEMCGNIGSETLELIKRPECRKRTPRTGSPNPNRAAVSGTEDIDQRFDLVPNPVSDVLNLIFENEDHERLIIIREINGKIVEMQPSKEARVNINTVKLPPGTYLCTVKSGSKVVNKKFIKL